MAGLHTIAIANLILMVLITVLFICFAFRRGCSPCIYFWWEAKDRRYYLVASLLLISLFLSWLLVMRTGNVLHKVIDASYEYQRCVNKIKNTTVCQKKLHYLNAMESFAVMNGFDEKKITAAVNSGKYQAHSDAEMLVSDGAKKE